MGKEIKHHGRVYTPNYIVKIILDFGNYSTSNIISKHVIDNSCGDGAFLVEIVNRYCNEFIKTNSDVSTLLKHLKTYVHGIELDEIECKSCIQNLNETIKKYNLPDISWDILNADTLTIHKYDGKMDYVFGNPPYVRVHNLDNSYEAVKQYRFAEKGMTDLFIVFFEIGFNMLADNGIMCEITPSSWLGSNAGIALRDYIICHKNLAGLIDLEHFQPFDATTYTLISLFNKTQKSDTIKYYNFNETTHKEEFKDNIALKEMTINGQFYLSLNDSLTTLHRIKATNIYKYVSVKNGFATLADKIFIRDFPFTEGTIEILKASTGKWSRCIFPYDKMGKTIPLQIFMKNDKAYKHLLSYKEVLTKERDVEDNKFWYLFGRTQAIKDVYTEKYAINTIIKDKNSIKLEKVSAGKGLYSGLYILTEIDFEAISQLIISEDFINYIKLLKKYKSGGYYTFSSKDLEQYLNFKLTEIYEQSRISSGNI